MRSAGNWLIDPVNLTVDAAAATKGPVACVFASSFALAGRVFRVPVLVYAPRPEAPWLTSTYATSVREAPKSLTVSPLFAR